MGDLVSVATAFAERDPMGANFIAQLLAHVPRYGKVILCFQNGVVVNASKEESFRPTLTTVGK